MNNYQKKHAELVSLHERTLKAYKVCDSMIEKDYLWARMYELLALMNATTEGMKESYGITYTAEGDFTAIGAVGPVKGKF